MYVYITREENTDEQATYKSNLDCHYFSVAKRTVVQLHGAFRRLTTKNTRTSSQSLTFYCFHPDFGVRMESKPGQSESHGMEAFCIN